MRELMVGVAFAALLAGPVAAQSVDELVVTANRKAQPRDKVASSMEVIGAAQLDNTVSLSFIEQVKKNASVDVIQYPNGLAGIGLRGLRPDFEFTINPRTLVLIDGRPSGSSSFTTISPESVERIEVLKGPGSALYGASAVGGVVNILTKRSKGPLSGTATVGYGSFETTRADLAMGGSLNGRTDFDLGVGYVDQNADFRTGGGIKRPNSDFRRLSGKLRLGADIAEVWRLDATLDAARLENNAPGPVTYNPQSRNYNATDRLGGDLRLEGRLDAHRPTLVTYASRETYNYSEAPPTAPRYRSTRVQTEYRGLQLQDVWDVFDDLTLTYGFDWQRLDAQRAGWTLAGARRAPSSPNERRETKAVFAEAVYEAFDDRLTLSLGGRQDWIEASVLTTPFRPTQQPGSAEFSVFNPRGGVVFKLTQAWRVHATAGKAFAPPQASQLAAEFEEFAGAQRRVTLGNPDLKPERNRTYDFGVGYSSARIQGDLTYFDSRTKDRIVSRVVLESPTLRRTTYFNADQSTSHGLEGVLTVDVGALAGMPAERFGVTASGTRIFQSEERVAGLESPIRNVAGWKGNISATVSNGGSLSATVSVRYDGARWGADNSQGRVFTNGRGGNFRFDPFATVDISARWRATDRDTLRIEVSNLFDEDFYEVADYPMPGRAVFVRYARSF